MDCYYIHTYWLWRCVHTNFTYIPTYIHTYNAILWLPKIELLCSYHVNVVFKSEAGSSKIIENYNNRCKKRPLGIVMKTPRAELKTQIIFRQVVIGIQWLSSRSSLCSYTTRDHLLSLLYVVKFKCNMYFFERLPGLWGADLGPMLWFFIYFRRKIRQKIGVFDSKHS
jgi:hypothetical protein